MTTLQRRLAFCLGVGLTLLGLLYLFDWSWKGLIVLLVLLLVVIGAYLKPLYDLVVHPPVRASSSHSHHAPEEEALPSYEQGYQEVVYYTPPPAMPKEERVTEDVPMAQYQYQYPEMRQEQF